MTALKILYTFITLCTLSHSLLHSTEKSDVEGISNPHIPTEEKNSCLNPCQPSRLLSPHQIILTPKVTQPDTLISITRERILSVPVPVYHFRQPERLSTLQLPFKLVLVNDVDPAGSNTLVEVSVDTASASDSWFPGFRWTPVVCGVCGSGEGLHVGWKFENLNGEFFYALIVATGKRERSEGGSVLEAVGELLNVGVRAPEWMLESVGKIW